METPSHFPGDPPTRREWLRFSLRAMFLGMAASGLGFGYLARLLKGVEQREKLVADLKALGAEVAFDHNVSTDRMFNNTTPPPPRGPAILRWAFGENAFSDVEWVCFLDPAKSKMCDEQLHLLKDLPRLTTVSLSGPGITDRGIKVLSELPAVVDVALVDTTVSADGLSWLAKSGRITGLSLVGENVTDDLLYRLPRFSNLKDLQLGRTRVTSEGLVPIRQMRNLSSLRIETSPNVGDDGLSHLSQCENLHWLHLANVNVCDKGLSHLGGCTGLRTLALQKLNCDGSGLEKLTELRIEMMFLWGATFRDNAIEQLIKFNSMWLVDIQNTSITDDGFRQLANNATLESFFVSSNISDDAINDIQAAKPGCRVHRFPQQKHEN